MIKFYNQTLNLSEGEVFKGTCGSYFKIIHKCDKDTYCVQQLGFAYKVFKFIQSKINKT